SLYIHGARPILSYLNRCRKTSRSKESLGAPIFGVTSLFSGKMASVHIAGQALHRAQAKWTILCLAPVKVRQTPAQTSSQYVTAVTWLRERLLLRFGRNKPISLVLVLKKLLSAPISGCKIPASV